MKKQISDYLQPDNKILGKVLAKVSQLQEWNTWLKENLEQDAAIAEHCFIVSLSGKSLIVYADNPHWVTRLRFHIPQLLPKLKKYPDFQNIQSICCKVHPNYTPISARHIREPQRKLSTQNANKVRQTAQQITDESLRVILEKIAKNSE